MMENQNLENLSRHLHYSCEEFSKKMQEIALRLPGKESDAEKLLKLLNDLQDRYQMVYWKIIGEVSINNMVITAHQIEDAIRRPGDQNIEKLSDDILKLEKDLYSLPINNSSLEKASQKKLKEIDEIYAQIKRLEGPSLTAAKTVGEK